MRPILLMGKQIDKGRPVIIALKGHPGTGKSTLARGIAKALKFPLIDKDHFRDCTSEIEQALTPAYNDAAKLLNDVSYSAMWNVVSTQLRLGVSVVVDSPLSRREHLERLMEMAAANDGRVVVVECRAGDEAEWRRRVESRGRGDGAKWHKPGNWLDIERLLDEYDGCWDYDVGEVPKLVLDTTGFDGVGDMVDRVIEFLCSLEA